MKLQEFLDCEHDIDCDSSMTRLYCQKCYQDANVINYVKLLEKKLSLAIKVVEFYATCGDEAAQQALERLRS